MAAVGMATAAIININKATEAVRRAPKHLGDLVQAILVASLAIGLKTAKRTLWRVLLPLRQDRSHWEKRRFRDTYLSCTGASLI